MAHGLCVPSTFLGENQVHTRGSWDPTATPPGTCQATVRCPQCQEGGPQGPTWAPLSLPSSRHQGQPRPTSHPRDGLSKGREVSSCHVGTSGSAAGTTGLPTQVPPTRGPKDGCPPERFCGGRTEVVREAFT